MRIRTLCALLLLGAATALAGEPGRSTLLDNERVRVMEVVFEPGDGEAEKIEAQPGRVWWMPKGSTQRAKNAGRERVVLRVVAIK